MVEQAISRTGQKRWVLVALALALVVAIYIFVTQSARSDIPDHGDWQNDIAHVVVARNFALHGFSALNFGAARDNGTELGLPPYYYTHLSPFPAIVLGFLYRLGLSTAEARVVPLLISSSALIAIFLMARRVLGDWRGGLAASLALATSVPFRLLSDSFAYPSYDFAAKTWTMLFITLGALAQGWRRLAWLLAAGIGSLATIALSGFEMVPAIGAYSFLFPLFFAATAANPRNRNRVAFLSALFVGGGFLLGMGVRLGHNALLLGDLNTVAADFWQTFVLRSSSDFRQFWEGGYLLRPPTDLAMYYLTLIVDRVLFYYPIHLVVIFLAFLIGGLMADALHGYLDWRPFKWLGIVFFSEALWFLIFRQHANIFVHTIYQLSLSASLGVAIAAMIMWRLAGRSVLGRIELVTAAVLLIVVSLGNIGVRTYGNLVPEVDLTPQKQQVESLSATLPVNAIVVLDLDGVEASPEFFLGRTFVRRPWYDKLEYTLPTERPWFLVTQPKLENELYRKTLATNPLLKKTQEYAIFDMNVLAKNE